jgi:predicted O-methyltransferase YrrM
VAGGRGGELEDEVTMTMSQVASVSRFAAERQTEPPVITSARRTALEWGVEPVSPVVGAHLAVLAAAVRARSIVEIGTGTGVSGLWLLHGAPEATLTTIDAEIDHQQAARQAFDAAHLPRAHVRTILGRATSVLDRLADGGYDLVFIDADLGRAVEYVAQGLRLARPGGLIVLAHALVHGAVTDPADRSEQVTALRGLLDEFGSREHIRSSLLPVDDGLFTIVAPGG